MTMNNSFPRPSEEDTLDRAIESIDPMLRASLQRDQKRRRRRVAITGGILMATALAVVIGFIIAGNGQSNTSEKQPAGKLDRLELASDLNGEGWKLWQKRQFAEAEKKFERAIKIDPKLDHAWNGLGWAHFNQGMQEEAVKAFQKCVELSPNHPGAWNGLGQASFLTGDLDNAEKYFLQAKNASAAWYGLVKVYLLKEDFAKARKWLRKLQRAGQNDGDLKEFAKAIANKKLDDELRKEIEPTTVASSNPNAAGLAQRGWKMFSQGKNRPAEAAFREALEADKHYLPAVNGLGFALLNQGKSAEARPMFERLLRENPEHMGALNGLARCLKTEGEIDKAIQVWKKIESQSRSVTAATTGLATTYFEQEKFKEAIPFLKRLQKAQPDNPNFSQMLKSAQEQIKKEGSSS